MQSNSDETEDWEKEVSKTLLQHDSDSSMETEYEERDSEMPQFSEKEILKIFITS